MKKRKSNLFWAIVAVVTTIACLTALMLHTKNWIKTKPTDFRVLSGFYYKDIKYSDLDSVEMVERIPPMIRLNGFSAFEKEKGVFQEFKDSLTDKKIYVFADNIHQPKIKVVYNDSIKMYLNKNDSLETVALFDYLKGKLPVSAPK